MNPVLPEWLPSIELEGLRVGNGVVRVAASRRGARTVVERLEGDGIELEDGTPPAPLVGRPG